MLTLHLVTVILVLAFPVWDYWETRRLRTTGSRMRSYIRSIAVIWLAALATLALLPLAVIWHVPEPMRSLTGAMSPDFLQTFVPTVLVALVLPMVATVFHAGIRRRIQQQYNSIDYLLPRTGREVALFAGVSVSAGICEEVLYRGFLFHALMAAPVSLAPIPTLLIGAALFGVAHIGQGLKGVLLTGAAGFFLGGLYILTGTLLVPIVVHILIDLRATVFAYLRILHRPETA